MLRQLTRPVIAVDPTLAVTAYLEQIPKAARLLAAARTDADHWRVGFTGAAIGGALGLIWASRALVHVRDRLAARLQRGEWVSPICALLFAFLLQAAWVAASVLSRMFWPTGADADLSGWVSGLPAEVLIGGLGAWLVLLALRRWPRWGWAGLSGVAGIAVICVVMVAPITLLPQLRGDRPVAPAAVAATSVLKFVRKGGLDTRTLYVFDGSDPLAVDMEGLGPVAHAAVSRAALAAPSAETYAAIGHLLGHYRRRDLWALTLLWSGFAAAFLWAVWASEAVMARKSGQGANAVVRLPVFGMIGWALILVAVPVFNVFDQAINYRADDYAMTLTRDPDALCRWLIATEASSKADPSPLEAVLFYDHPPLKARLANALRWKAAHP